MSHTPGPWAWFGNTKNHDIALATTHGGRKFVMGFARWGMGGAQPRFRVDGVMRPASDLVKFEVEYRQDIETIDHADARLIEAAPELLAALKQCAEAIDEEVAYADGDDHPTIQRHVATLASARAVIAKAEGRS